MDRNPIAKKKGPPVAGEKREKKNKAAIGNIREEKQREEGEKRKGEKKGEEKKNEE